MNSWDHTALRQVEMESLCVLIGSPVTWVQLSASAGCLLGVRLKHSLSHWKGIVQSYWDTELGRPYRATCPKDQI